jgi:hypothetical protein
MTSLPARCLEAAGRIGRWIVESAQWDNDACTWEIVVPDFSNSRLRRGATRRELAGPNIYHGTAGIAVFLSELLNFDGDPNIRRTARGALTHAINGCRRLRPHDFGFHSGRVGVAYALSRYAESTGDALALDEARNVLKPILGQERNDRGLDVISGAAGSIPVLLLLSEALSFPALRNSAEALGDRLLATARRNLCGWSWDSPARGNARDLCGFAHGASGCAAALLELWAVTGSARFLYGGQRALDYEAYHFAPQVENWPDFRHLDWGEILGSPERLREVQSSIRAGEDPPRYSPHYMSAWCHGAPGIALTRLRAFELLGDASYEAEAKVALKTTHDSVRAGLSNYSLCHGIFGNCEPLLWGSALFSEPQWHDTVEACISEAITEIVGTARRWPTGVFGAQPDPGLLMGEAGIGHFLLRFVNPAIPSVLYPRFPVNLGPIRVQAHHRSTLFSPFVEAERSHWFGHTLQAARCLGALSMVEDAVPTGLSPLMFGDSLDSLLGSGGPDTDGAKSLVLSLLADASRVERALVESTRSFPDSIDEDVFSLLRPDFDALNWDSARWCFAPLTQLIVCLYDWDHWLKQCVEFVAASPPPLFLAERPCVHVLFRRDGAMQQSSAGHFLAMLLTIIRDGSRDGVNSQQLTLEFSAATGIAATNELSGLIRHQLQHAYRCGIITVT